MPHSSGGGHSHGGSHRSRRGSKPADMRFGNRYYPGAMRFRFYRNGTPEYYYSDRPYTLQEAKKEKTRSFFSSFFTAVMGIFCTIVGLFSFPHKITTDYNTEIVIRDKVQLLTTAEETEISEAFRTFLDKTGVTPAFYTITEEEKQGRSLESYAYDLYIKTFDDEKHWLVVYCGGNDGTSWEWEGMIGDDCGGIITDSLEDELTRRMQKNLENNPNNISGAVIDAFNTIGGKAGGFSFKNLRGVGLTLIFGLLCLYAAVKKFFKTLKTDPSADPRINSEPYPESEPEAGPKPGPGSRTTKCEHCGGEFDMDDHTTACPFCGAPLENWE